MNTGKMTTGTLTKIRIKQMKQKVKSPAEKQRAIRQRLFIFVHRIQL